MLLMIYISKKKEDRILQYCNIANQMILFLFKKTALKIINIWDCASVPHYHLNQTITNITVIYNKYKLYNTNKLRLKRLYIEYDTLFDLYKQDCVISRGS